MWFFRGAQSAVFYYLACTPCAKANYRQKRRNDAIKARKEKAAREENVITDQPRPFPQPTPFTTNPSWAEDIALGPGPYRRGRNNRADRDFSPIEVYQFSHNLDERARREQWVGMHFQREDEALWGQKEPDNYCIPKVPPVNDLHPPVVSGPKSRAEVSWMLQPPPIAKVMEGKEPPNRQSSPSKDNPGNSPDDKQNGLVSRGPSTTSQPAKSLTVDGSLQSIAPVPRRPARALQPSIASFYYHSSPTDDPTDPGQLPSNYHGLSDSSFSTPSVSRKSTPTQNSPVDLHAFIADIAQTNMNKEALEMHLRKLQGSDKPVVPLEAFANDRPPCRFSSEF